MTKPRKPAKASESTPLKTKQVPYYVLKPVFSFATKKDAVRALVVIREALHSEFVYPVFEGDPSESSFKNCIC